MSEASGERPAVIYDTTQTGYAPLASGNNNLVSTIFELKYNRVASFHILTDGGAKVNYTLQVTDIPRRIISGEYQRQILGSPTRDDSYGSTQWSTVQTGQLATGSAQGTLITLTTCCYLDARLLFNWDASNTGGTTAKILALGRGMGSA